MLLIMTTSNLAHLTTDAISPLNVFQRRSAVEGCLLSLLVHTNGAWLLFQKSIEHNIE